jgi:hypothetical protein
MNYFHSNVYKKEILKNEILEFSDKIFNTTLVPESFQRKIFNPKNG